MRVEQGPRASWVVWCGCIGVIAGCAGSFESAPPAATPSTEPDSMPANTGEGATLSSDEPEEPVAVIPSVNEVERGVATESEADQRDRDMREAIEGPATARGRAADNSAQNERDRTGSAITPIEQSDEAPDLELTAKIRRTLVDERSLSIDAKSVKIVVEDGQVTLSGRVDSVAEKERVESLARQAGNGRVISLLEVKH